MKVTYWKSYTGIFICHQCAGFLAFYNLKQYSIKTLRENLHNKKNYFTLKATTGFETFITGYWIYHRTKKQPDKLLFHLQL